MATKKCKGCGDRYEKQEDHPPFRNWCGIECALSIARTAQEKARAKKQAKDKREHREKEKASTKALRDFNKKDLRWQHKQTQKTFNRMRVLEELKWFRDNSQEPTCISCGKPNMDWCCGHHKTVGSQGRLRYDTMNTFLQCNRYCNMGKSGNIEGCKNTRGYKKGLRERFGEDKGQAIIDYCETNTGIIKWEWQDLEAMRKDYNQRIRELEKEIA